MKHSSTRTLFSHWHERRGDQAAPSRADIDPVGIRQALGDTFMLAVDFVDQHRFRLAGTRICTLFGRELKGEAFSALWHPSSLAEVQDILRVMSEESSGVVAGLTGRTAEGDTAELELLLLPLAHQGHARIRAVGTIAAIEMPYWAGEKPLTELELGMIRHVGIVADDITPPPFIRAPDGGRVRHGFMVYDGGRAASNSRSG